MTRSCRASEVYRLIAGLSDERLVLKRELDRLPPQSDSARFYTYQRRSSSTASLPVREERARRKPGVDSSRPGRDIEQRHLRRDGSPCSPTVHELQGGHRQGIRLKHREDPRVQAASRPSCCVHGHHPATSDKRNWNARNGAAGRSSMNPRFKLPNFQPYSAAVSMNASVTTRTFRTLPAPETAADPAKEVTADVAAPNLTRRVAVQTAAVITQPGRQSPAAYAFFAADVVVTVRQGPRNRPYPPACVTIERTA